MNNLFSRVDLPFQLARPGEPFLLAADIDGTMLGDGLGEAWLKAFRRESTGDFLLAYVSGRDFGSVMQLVDEDRLPYPNFICSDVGTEIHDLNDPQNVMGEKYTAQVGPGWNPETIYALGEGDGVRRQASIDGQSHFQAGFDMLHAVRRHRPSLPVIALTAYASDRDRQRVLAAGFHGFISKPVDAAKLTETIRAVLDGAASPRLEAVLRLHDVDSTQTRGSVTTTPRGDWSVSPSAPPVRP